MKEGFVIEKFKTPETETNPNTKFVSYSQFSTWKNCPKQWKLNHVDKLRVYDASIHTIFGDAMHFVLQEYLTIMYTQTIKKSEEYDTSKALLEQLKSGYAKALEKGDGTHFTNKEQLSEFYLDGVEILNWIKKKRKMFFSPKQEELVGIEVPLITRTKNPNVHLNGFIDIVFKDKINGRIKIKDFKTSTNGWNKWAKQDENKVNQLLLYKIYFAQQYDLDIDTIDVEYFILKRKIDLDSAFPQRRVQVFVPSQGKISYNRVIRDFERFLDSCFLPDGSYNLLTNYIANKGKNGKNCQWCDFKEKHDICPPNERICLE